MLTLIHRCCFPPHLKQVAGGCLLLLLFQAGLADLDTTVEGRVSATWCDGNARRNVMSALANRRGPTAAWVSVATQSAVISTCGPPETLTGIPLSAPAHAQRAIDPAPGNAEAPVGQAANA